MSGAAAPEAQPVDAGTSAPRRATRADLDAMVALLGAALGRSAGPLRRQLTTDLAADGYAWFVLDASGPGELAGVAGVRHVGEAGDADVLDVAVAAPHRRRGLGRQLVGCLVTQARRANATSLVLEVAVDNDAAQRLYETCGFERTRVREGYTHDGRDAWEMVRSLGEDR